MSENGSPAPLSVGGDGVFAGLPNADRLAAGDSRSEEEWRSRMVAACGALEELLSLGLGGDIRVQMGASGTVRWGEVLERRGSGGVTGYRTEASPGGFSAIWFEPVAAGLLLECILGGSVQKAVPISRDASELECQFLGDLIFKIGHVLFPAQAVGNDKGTPDASFGIIPNRQLEQAMDPEGRTSLGEFQITFADGICGAFLAMAPLESAYVGASDAVASHTVTGSASRAARKRRLEKLGGVMLDFEVKLEGNTIALAEIASLQVGDVIALESELSAPLTGSLNSDRAFEGSVVPSGPRKVFRIERVISRLP